MWYAMQVYTGMEEAARQLIYKLVDERLFSDCFVVRFERSRRYMGKWHKENQVWFPGYIFIDTDMPLEIYEELKKVPKMTKMLGREVDYFLPIRKEEEEFLKKLVGVDHTIEMSVGYIEGDRIIVTEGALLDKEGLIKKIDRHKRQAVISIELFGQMIDTTVGLEVITKT